MKKVIKKSKILTLMLILTMTFATLTGCGDSNLAGGESSSTEATNLGSSTEETTVAVEGIVPETATKEVYTEMMNVTVSLPKSDKTKSMLIEKLTNLEFTKGQEFNTSSLNFDSVDLQEKYDVAIKKMLSDILGAEYNDNNTAIKCNYLKIKIYSVLAKSDGLQISYDIGYYFNEYKLDYSKYAISNKTKAMLMVKLTDLTLLKGQEFDMNSLSFKSDEQAAYNEVKYKILGEAVSYGNDSAIGDGSVLKCLCTKVELYRIESDDTGMTFFIKCFD